MLIHVGHLTGEEDMLRVFRTLHSENHLPFGTPPVLEEGAQASLLWFAQSDPIEALRMRQKPRVFQNGLEIKEGGFEC
jgi:hypothetical protein